jgi:hypothetical protein
LAADGDVLRAVPEEALLLAPRLEDVLRAAPPEDALLPAPDRDAAELRAVEGVLPFLELRDAEPDRLAPLFLLSLLALSAIVFSSLMCEIQPFSLYPDGLGGNAQGPCEPPGLGSPSGTQAAAQGPLHAVRGEGEQEKMLHNARAEYAGEAAEIATYTVIESLATAVGDKDTAKLARDILRDEERRQKYLAGLLPELTTDVVHDTIPISEIEGTARRAAPAGR